MSDHPSRDASDPDAVRPVGPTQAGRIWLTVDVRGDGDGTVIITPHGEIDMSTDPLLRKALFAAVAEDHTHTILVDMSAVTFLDSTGIATLVSAYHTATTSDRTVRLANTRPPVTQTLKITGLLKTFGLPDL